MSTLRKASEAGHRGGAVQHRHLRATSKLPDSELK
jgi:hypothetical protein